MAEPIPEIRFSDDCARQYAIESKFWSDVPTLQVKAEVLYSQLNSFAVTFRERVIQTKARVDSMEAWRCTLLKSEGEKLP